MPVNFFVVGVFLQQACNFIKKETLAQVFSCEFCEISKNTFLQKNSVAASAKKTAKNFFVDTGDIRLEKIL